jgi:hypothetical protein
MNTDNALRILEGCERALREELAKAAGRGDYDGVRRIMMWAENLRAMAKAGREEEREARRRGDAATGRKGDKGRREGTEALWHKGTEGMGFKTRMIQDEYPRFRREGEELVKVGWSKSEKKEYVHRAPRKALDAVVSAIKRLGERGGTFGSDAINPLKDPEGGVFPTYQVFVALAWLRELGLVKQLGRKGGYVLARERALDGTVDGSWEELGAGR